MNVDSVGRLDRLVDVKYLRECFFIDPQFCLRWKIRPLSHFKTERDRKIFNKNMAGELFGCDNGNGYIRGRVGGRCEYAHRIIYVLFYGVDISGVLIDHADGDRKNNNPTNLRVANKAQNGINRKKKSSGVHWNSRSKKWHAQATIGGKRTFLGLFEDKSQAEFVAYQARMREYGEFAEVVGCAF